MTDLHFHFAGKGQLQWANTDKDICRHLGIYLKEEEALAPAERIQNPSFAEMQRLYQALSEALRDAEQQETTRALEKDHYDSLFSRLHLQGERAIAILKGMHHGQLQQLSAWGLDVVGEMATARVRKPYKDDTWRRFFADYVTQERSLPPAERVAGIDFDQFERDQQQLEQHRKRWMKAWQARQGAVEDRRHLGKQALQYLRWGLASLVLSRFKGEVTQSVERWGYRLIER